MSLLGLGVKDIVDTIVFYHGQQQIAKYLAVVSITLLVYDWVLNIDLEAALIWGHKWSWGRVIYHTNRIWPIVLLGVTLTVILFLPLPSPSTCRQIGFMYSYGAMCQCTIISAMLLLRCWALYDRKRVVWILFGGLVAAIVSGIVIVKFLLDRTAFLANPLPNIFSGCVVMVPDYVWILYIVPLVYESSLFALTIWRIYELSKDFGATPLMQTLAQNGTAYFATLVGLMILACIGGTIQTVKIASNASGILSAISSVVCSRMIFSLYRIAEKEGREGQTLSNIRSDTNGDIIPQFAIPLQSLTGTSIPYSQSQPKQTSINK